MFVEAQLLQRSTANMAELRKCLPLFPQSHSLTRHPLFALYQIHWRKPACSFTWALTAALHFAYFAEFSWCLFFPVPGLLAHLPCLPLVPVIGTVQAHGSVPQVGVRGILRWPSRLSAGGVPESASCFPANLRPPVVIPGCLSKTTQTSTSTPCMCATAQPTSPASSYSLAPYSHQL